MATGILAQITDASVTLYENRQIVVAAPNCTFFGTVDKETMDALLVKLLRAYTLGQVRDLSTDPA